MRVKLLATCPLLFIIYQQKIISFNKYIWVYLPVKKYLLLKAIMRFSKKCKRRISFAIAYFLENCKHQKVDKKSPQKKDILRI